MDATERNGDFVYADEFVPGLRWDAKYATYDNFTGRPVDGYLANRIVGTRALCNALARAHEHATAYGLGIFVWDAYRPQRAVDDFLHWLQLPEDGRTKSQYYPNIDKADMVALGYVDERSGHSRGSTVDLTLYDLATGKQIPMGGGFDLMDPLSHYGAEGITRREHGNRERLGEIMESFGFQRYEFEWWHFSLKNEPHPTTYFDFPITNPPSRFISGDALGSETTRIHS